MIKENVVKVPFRKLKHIHHISDIQIRNLKRHKEYEEVFERTYEQVKKHKNNAVAYIGGDIAHSKTEMSPVSNQPSLSTASFSALKYF